MSIILSFFSSFFVANPSLEQLVCFFSFFLLGDGHLRPATSGAGEDSPFAGFCFFRFAEVLIRTVWQVVFNQEYSNMNLKIVKRLPWKYVV